MADFITDGLITDPNEILTGMIADYQARVPDWEPSDGDPASILFSVIALRHAVRLDVDSQGPHRDLPGRRPVDRRRRTNRRYGRRRGRHRHRP